ncbi:MAG: DUF2809 domain-containing protein [Micropruina sp.]|uniref:ribosomal maturation YjgA family protein n=1 Tax=Micropruina sp. TaxID=2737536 RepID=UPI0039E70023
MTTPGRRRLFAAGGAAATVLAGLTTHFVRPHGTSSDIAGDALYAVLIYTLVVFALPRTPPAVAAVIAGSACVAIELFQLTGLPRLWAATFSPIALVLGTGFDVRDLVVYVVAVAVAGLIDRFSRRTTT